MLPGSQTAFELDDVRAGLSYTVRVSARVGAREGGASILTVRRGEYCRRAVGGQLPAWLTAVLILTSDLFHPQNWKPHLPSQGCESWHRMLHE